MNLRRVHNLLREGAWVLEPGTVQAKTDFQRERLTAAVSIAQVYLQTNMGTAAIGKSLGVTSECAAQKIRLGINYMVKAGWLHRARPAPPTGS